MRAAFQALPRLEPLCTATFEVHNAQPASVGMRLAFRPPQSFEFAVQSRCSVLATQCLLVSLPLLQLGQWVLAGDAQHAN